MRSINLNKDWRFSLDKPAGPHLIESSEEEYRAVDLPHDWSVEFPFDKENGEGCTGYLPGGFGWYRKHFITSAEMVSKKVFLCFDGVYNNASIYVNGRFVDMHPYGYSPFNYDITDYLNPVNEDNLIAVSVDRTRFADSRWYTGSGIYRDVKLLIADKLHIPIWAASITASDININYCDINISAEVINDFKTDKSVELKYSVCLADNSIVASDIMAIDIAAGDGTVINNTIKLHSPILWDIDNPYLYKVSIDVLSDGDVVDIFSTRVGIRHFHFDVAKGFFLNGINTLVKGVCLHHDCGLIGAAMYVDVWRRRLKKLKECGCNAIRTGHTPVSKSFLDLCDEMGFLVQEEFFDEWDNPKDKRLNGTEKSVDYLTRGYSEHFQKWAKNDLQSTVLRDRNHPCIFQWCIGNEIEWTYPKYNIATGYFGADASGNYFWDLPPFSVETIRKNISLLPEEEHEVGKTAKKLARWTREMDTTRPIIANCILPSASYESGCTDALDIVGFSYRQIMYEHCHKNYPDKPIMGTENLAQWHEWKHVVEKEYIPGIFLWTGIDYMGEAGNPPRWPQKGEPAGLLDLAGFEKHSYYMFKSLWQDKPTIHFATQTLDKSLYKLEGNILVEKIKDGWKQRLWHWHDVNWHWNYAKDEDAVIEIYSNCDEITLYSNDINLGTKRLEDFEDHIYKWHTKFRAGVLKAIGKKGDEDIVTSLWTASEPAAIRMYIEKGKEGIAHIEAQLIDANDNPVTWQEMNMEFTVDGECRVLGIDNGDICNVNSYKSMSVDTHKGRCLMILQSFDKGKIKVTAKADDIINSQVLVN